MFCPNLSTFAWRRHVGVPPGGNQHGGHRKPTLRSYARKVCIHHSRNSTNTRFNTRTRQEAKSKKKHSFDVYDSSRGAI